MHFSDYVSGAKTCIELIAVYAANHEEKMEKKSYLRSFQRFINYLQNFDDLNIHFEEDEHQVLIKSRPRVMDPVNPYNNLATEWDRKSIGLIKSYANETKRRLDILASTPTAPLNKLFEPQPVLLPEIREIFGCNSTKWLIGTTATDSLFPDLKIRNKRFGNEKNLRKGLEILKVYFQFAICTSRASGYDESKTQEVMQNTIDKHVDNTESTWSSSSSNDKHEDYDVTFTIPSLNQKAMRISYRL